MYFVCNRREYCSDKKKRELELTKLSKNPTRSGMEYQTQIRIQAL